VTQLDRFLQCLREAGGFVSVTRLAAFTGSTCVHNLPDRARDRGYILEKRRTEVFGRACFEWRLVSEPRANAPPRRRPKEEGAPLPAEAPKEETNQLEIALPPLELQAPRYGLLK
jgi:hypothetical protein